MIHHADILDTQESLGRPFVAAVTLHLAVIAAIVLYNITARPGEQFGGQNPAGGSVAVDVIDKIPLPHQGMTNPVANESESQVPQAADQEKTRKIQAPPPDAIPLKNRKAKQKPAERTASARHFVPYKELQQNQLTSTVPQQVSRPEYAQKAGSGRVGTGANTTLGTRFAGYATQIQEIVARNWKTADVDARLQTAPVVIADFDLMRDGSIRNVTILQSSGIPSLDFSVKRAILDSNPLPPIPPGFDKSYAKVEFTFELKR